MRWAGVLCLVAVAGGSAAGDPARKRAPDKFTQAAGDAFTRAVEAEDGGNLRAAAALYQTSLEIAVHANTLFNLAGVQVKLGTLRDAVISYEMYLALAPSASDRKAVVATIAELRARPGTLFIHARYPRNPSFFDLADAFVIVDGVIVSRPGKLARGGGPQQGIKVPVPVGRHTIDVITSVTYYRTQIETTYGQTVDVDVFGRPRVDGNVVVHGLVVDIGLEDSELDSGGDRFVIPPGTHQLKVTDRGFECSPIELAAPKGDAVVYVRIAPSELRTLNGEGPRRCRKLAVEKHVLAF